MPHLVILYTPQLDAECDMTALCRRLADTMLAQRDDEGRPVFPVGGTRVLAYPAAHHAVADGSGDHAFAWFHLRMARGRPEALRQRIGEALRKIGVVLLGDFERRIPGEPAMVVRKQFVHLCKLFVGHGRCSAAAV